jgi:hypothetical protein
MDGILSLNQVHTMKIQSDACRIDHFEINFELLNMIKIFIFESSMISRSKSSWKK